MNFFGEILLDGTSGSGKILEKVQDKLIEIATAEELVDSEKLIWSLNTLVYQFPQFGLTHHFCQYLVENLNAVSGVSIKGKEIAEFVEEYVERWKGAQTMASKQLLSTIDLNDKSILVHSNSSSIQNLFHQVCDMADKPVIWQTFSSPKGEGKLQAKHLLDLGFEIHLFHEDNLNRYLKELDMAILGADLILEDHFLNKSGSFSISLMFQHAGLPVYLLAEERKHFQVDDISKDLLRIIENETNKPLFDFGIALDERLITHNHYFEYTPLSMVNQLFLGEETK